MMGRRISIALCLIIVSFITGCAPRISHHQGITPGGLPSLTPSPVAAHTAPQATLTRPAVTPTRASTASPAPTATPAPAVLIGAGDIAYCGSAPEYQSDEQTAALVKKLLEESPDAVVMTAGDNAYEKGTRAEFKNCFDPTWGQFKDRIRPAPGNHDYGTKNGAPYYEYFGAAAGPAGLGYYSYDLGDWHIVALNSNCDQVACTPNSQQVKWLREDLQKNTQKCTLTYWHHPRWSSGLSGGQSAATLWKTVATLGVDVVVNGHDHDYERFAPMSASGDADPSGTREFVVGTGGAELRIWGTIKPNSEVHYSGTHGVIEFKLYPDHYDWSFIPVEKSALTDMGTGYCH